MALYEITFLTKEETDPGVRAALEEVGATIESASSLGRKRLAYPIRREQTAVFTTFIFNAEPSVLAGLTRKFGLNTSILRYLMVSKPIARANKEVSKTVREAIAAAEKLEDTTAETIAPENRELGILNLEAELPTEEVAPPVVLESTSETIDLKTAKPKTKRVVKKAVPADSAEATEVDRLKALEERLGEILKD